MNFIEDEPRKHPTPVPFSENPLLKPTVPEVSLLLQDKVDDSAEKKSDSFSGTEFQTYNAWKWKHVNDKASEIKAAPQYKSSQNCCLIKDKYSSSGIEKRKNEILYGFSDEPRRPLPPRLSPVIPDCSELFFSNTSCDDLRSVGNESKEKQIKQSNKRDFVQNVTLLEGIKKDLDSSEKLYKIISEQNKRVEVFEKQIEQLLKLQDMKDKQIEQLLHSLDLKDKELEQLLRLKKNQDEQMQELLQSQAKKQKEYLEVLKKLNEIQTKDVFSVGTMTDLRVTNACTNTSFELNFQNTEAPEDMSVMRDSLESNRQYGREKSLSLHSSDLPVIPENIPTPQSSIHLDIQDFHDLSDGSDSESRAFNNNFPSSVEAPVKPLGYTFYNNVLTQVKDIIENSGEKENKRQEKDSYDTASKPSHCNYVTEKRGKVQTFQTWGVVEREKILPSNSEINVEKYRFEIPNFDAKDTLSPSDVSLKINALALKYLKQEQISQYEVSPQIPNFCQRDLTIYNVTNLSFGSTRYMDGCQVLPKGKGELQQEMNMQQNIYSPTHLLRRKKKMAVQENMPPSFGNILDISTINQQPKLL